MSSSYPKMPARTPGSGEYRRISASDPRYGSIVDFLYDEAALLDEDRHIEWLDLLSDDIRYKMPARITQYRAEGDGFQDGGVPHFDDDRLTLALRAQRNSEVRSAFDRDPLPRIRRMVSNVVVYEGHDPSEYRVRSYILLVRNRFDAFDHQILSARREDTLIETPDGLKLLERLIIVDQVVLDSPYANVFL